MKFLQYDPFQLSIYDAIKGQGPICKLALIGVSDPVSSGFDAYAPHMGMHEGICRQDACIAICPLPARKSNETWYANPSMEGQWSMEWIHRKLVQKTPLLNAMPWLH